jgi:FAD/FMN-containing dehydrogenase
VLEVGLVRRGHPVELALMRTLEDALDPRGLMNPGKVQAERPLRP